MKKLYEATRIPMILVSHSHQEMSELAEERIYIENGKFSAQAKFNWTQKQLTDRTFLQPRRRVV